MRKRLIVAAALFMALAASPASATTIFSDNFDSENGGVGALNYAGFANFTVSGGTVDLIGNGFFSFPPVTTGHGLYLDLDGSTNSAGILLAHSIPVMPGVYQLTFELAGSQRHAGPEIIDVQVMFDTVPFLVGSFLVNDTDPFGTHTVPFGISTIGGLTFSFHNRGGDNIGALLDNVAVTEVTTPVPEPASMVLFGTGFLAAAVRRYRRPR